MIAAHTSQLAAIAFSPSGKRVATASEKGTVIRVFSVVDGGSSSKLYELRRGLKRTVNIHSLSFSPCGHFLACSSNTETVHVFKLDEKPRER
jgi:autophagy-related protein 18